jgi:anti-anti-sigma factor
VDLNIKVSDASGAALVTVTGALAGEAAPAFGKALDHLCSSGRPIMVDLEGATGLDPLGLSVLVQAFRRLRESECALIVVAPPPAVRKVIDDSGVEDFMPICHTIQEATALITVLHGRSTSASESFSSDSLRRPAGPELS